MTINIVTHTNAQDNPSTEVVRFCLFSGETDTTPKARKLSIDGFKQLLLAPHKRRQRKDGDLFSPVVYRSGEKRSNDGVDYVTMIVFDLDHAEYQPTMDRLRASGHNCIVYSSFSSTPEAPRFRVVFFLTRNVYPLEYDEIRRRINHWIFNDEACPTNDISRMFFLPSCPPDGHPFAFEIEGKLLDPRELAPIPAEKPARDAAPVDIDDAALVEKAKSAANGTGAKFTRLWNGDTSGYESHSQADMALCDMLMFWTNHDIGRADSLFRQSGLMRPKWDEIHSTSNGRQTYGEITLAEADTYIKDGYTQRRQEQEQVVDVAEAVGLPAGTYVGMDDPLLLTIFQTLHVLTLENVRLRELIEGNAERSRLEAQVMANPDIQGAKKLAALAIVRRIDHKARLARFEERANVPIYRKEIAEVAGVSEDSVGKTSEWMEAEGWLARKLCHVPKKQDGEIVIVRESHQQLTAPASDILVQLASYKRAPEEKRHGGYHPKRYCPDHPHADLVQSRNIICSECGQIVEKREPWVIPSEYESSLSNEPQHAAYEVGPQETPSDPEPDNATVTKCGYYHEDACCGSTDRVLNLTCLDCGVPLAEGRKYYCPACVAKQAAGHSILRTESISSEYMERIHLLAERYDFPALHVRARGFDIAAGAEAWAQALTGRPPEDIKAVMAELEARSRGEAA